MARPIALHDPGWRRRLTVFGRGSVKLNMANFVDTVADLYGNRSAFALDRTIDEPGFKGDVMSFEDVRRMVNRMGHALRSLGVSKGDRVCLMTANRVEMAFCSYAAAKIGAIPVPLNFMLRPPEIDHIVRTSGARVLVCDRDVFEACVRDTTKVPAVAKWAMIGEEDPGDPFVSMRALMRDAPDVLEAVEPRSNEEAAMLFFTSGTTGFPKGATLSHDAMMAGVRWVGRLELVRPKMPPQRGLLVMPVAHSGGYVATQHFMTIGATTYFMSRFSPEEVLDVIEREKITFFVGSPAIYRMLLDAGAASRDLSSIRVWGGGSDAFDDELVQTFRDLAARRTPLWKRRPMFVRGYGMAEANSHVGLSPPWPAGDNCMGWILPPLKWRIVDEDGRDARRGELLLKGPQVMKGYWNDPAATAAALENGWYHTGDIVRRGRWRMLYFVGRSGDLIKSGGYKISATEIDTVLESHPAVLKSATVGVPDRVKGERPMSAVQLGHGATATEDELLEWARERLAPYKAPRRVLIVRQLPLTISLKVRRAEVRAMLETATRENASH